MVAMSALTCEEAAVSHDQKNGAVFNLQSASTPRGTKAGLTKQVRSFIETNFAKIQSVSQIAGEFRVSLPYLAKVFRNLYGIGPKEYLDAVRIKAAMKLLQKKNLLCYEIAKAVGLKDEDALGKLFRRQNFLSPKVLRKNWREGRCD